MDLPDLPYPVLVPVAIQLVKFGIELWRQPRSKSPSRSPISAPTPKEATMTRYVVLYTERIQKLRLPDDVDVSKVKTTITEAIETGRSTSIRVVTDGHGVRPRPERLQDHGLYRGRGARSEGRGSLTGLAALPLVNARARRSPTDRMTAGDRRRTLGRL